MQVTQNLRGVTSLTIFCPQPPYLAPPERLREGEEGGQNIRGQSIRGCKTSYSNILFPSFLEINPRTVLRFAYLFCNWMHLFSIIGFYELLREGS